GALIPPSLFLVLYAIVTGESVAAMLATGIIPGIISALAYATHNIITAKRNQAEWDERALKLEDGLVATCGRAPPVSAPAGAQGSAAAGHSPGVTTPTASLREAEPPVGHEIEMPPIDRKVRMRDLPMRGVVRVFILFLIVLGGIYSGLFTPTESAAVGALAA